MAIPGYSWKFEEELGVDKSKGMDSYDYMVTYEAVCYISLKSRIANDVGKRSRY